MYSRDKTRRALWSYAFFRVESALTIAGTLVLSVLAASNVPWLPGQWWMWLGAGLVAEAFIVYSTVSDQSLAKSTENQMFTQQFDLSRLRNKTLREKVSKALEYRSAIIQEIDRKDNKAVDDNLREMTAELEGWISQVYHLAQVLDVYTQDAVIARDMEQVPKDLRFLEVKLSQERNANVRQELQTTFDHKAKQYEALETLRGTMEKANLQLENTLSALGTVYMQTLNLGAKELSSTEAQRLQAQMREQVLSLEDINAAMDEVYKLGS
jgi:type I restriction-modification system DNA methylase subunit